MTRATAAFILGILALSLSNSPAADWPRFRGPNGSGIAEGELPPIDPKKPLWKVPIPGKGVSSPIVVGNKVLLQTGALDGKSRTLLCLDAASGKPLWTKDVPGSPARPKAMHAKNSLASSTPTSDGEHIYCVWWDGAAVSLNAYDMSGNEKWSASLGPWESQHGPGSSPVVHRGMVFVNVDDDEHAELAAFDAKTGDRKWIAPRKHFRASYTTPYILKRDNRPEELLLGTTTAITSYDPATGKVNWEYELPWPKGSKVLRIIGHPVYVAGLLVMAGGDGDGSRFMIAVDPVKKDKVWGLDDKALPYVPCMLVKDDMLFWIGDKPGGQAACAVPKTGKVLYSERISTMPPSASPILIGDKILLAAEDGEIVVFKAAKELDIVTKVKLGEGVFASPALADGRLFIRGTKHLYCFGK